MKSLITLVCCFLLISSCAQSTQNTSKDINEVTQTELNSVTLVDVRTPEEFDAGHLDNAKNINVYEDDFAKQFEFIAKDETIYVYCKMGGRSAQAQEKLKALGYTNIVNLEGGYDAYLEK